MSNGDKAIPAQLHNTFNKINCYLRTVHVNLMETYDGCNNLNY